MGPFNQFKKMFAESRAIATTIVIVSFALTLFAALKVSFKTPTFIPLTWLFNVLVAQCRFGSIIHNYTITGDDLVFFILHSVCKGCC